MLFEENIQVDFLRQNLRNLKLGNPNLDFNKLFCGERLINSEKPVKKCLFVEFEENR